MSEEKIKLEMQKCLDNINNAIDLNSKIMWQNIYFWWVRNNDYLVSKETHDK